MTFRVAQHGTVCVVFLWMFAACIEAHREPDVGGAAVAGQNPNSGSGAAGGGGGDPCDVDTDCTHGEPVALCAVDGHCAVRKREAKDAIIAICESPQGSGHWGEARNGCGGWTLETVGGAIEYVSFAFDAAGNLMGLTRWNDSPDQCDRIYGKPCQQPGGALATMECPAAPGAGSRQ